MPAVDNILAKGVKWGFFCYNTKLKKSRYNYRNKANNQLSVGQSLANCEQIRNETGVNNV